jgi:hypothetical protein
MTEYIESEKEKRMLHEVYKNKLEDLKKSFNKELNDFKGSWGERLKQRLVHDSELAVTGTSIPELSDSKTAVKIESKNGQTERWFFYVDNTETWAGMTKVGWWRDDETWEKNYEMDDGDRRIQFYHQFPRKRDDKRELLLNNKLNLSLQQKSSDEREFVKFMRDSYKNNPETYPRNTEVTEPGESHFAPLRFPRKIPVESHETFFDAYIAALSDGFVELVTSRKMITDAENNIKKAREEARKSI